MRRLEDIDLNLLLLLHWLLEECSVTRAANRLGISQPAASRGLKRLRDEFSDELLVKTGRIYVRSLLADSIQVDLAQAIQQLRFVAHIEKEFDPKISTKKITIACNDYLSTICAKAWLDMIVPYAPMMRSSWRPLEISVKDALVSGKVDLAIFPKVAQANMPKLAMFKDMVVKPLLEDKFVLFGPKTHSVMTSSKLTLEALAGANHVLVSPQGEGPGIVDRTLAEYNLKRNITHRTSSFNHAMELAIMTQSVAVIPKRLAKMKPNGGFRSLPFDTEKLSIDIIWHVSRTSDKTHTWVRHQLQKYFKS